MSFTKLNIMFATLFSFMLISTTNITEHQSPSSAQMNEQIDELKEKYKEKYQHVDQAQIDEFRRIKLTYIAKYFGIDVNGKSLEQLKQEIEKAKREQPEKWAMLKKELHEKKLKMLEQKSVVPIK